MRYLRQKIRDLLRRKDGNFATMTALVLPVLLGTAGMAIDATNMVLSKSQLQDATDAAALAVSSRLADKKIDSAGGTEYGKSFVAGRFSNVADTATVAAIKTATTVSITTTAQGSSGKSFKVAVSSRLSVPMTPLTRLIFGQQVNVSAASRTESGYGGPRGLSMEVLLDQSGSMAPTQRCTGILVGTLCLLGKWEDVPGSKAEALKTAAKALFDGLDKADPNAKSIRTGAISYSSVMTGQSAMAWGTAAARSFVNAMPRPSGGTDATTALLTATNNIKESPSKSDTESVEQKKNKNDPVDRAIVLMTDGEMTGATDAWVLYFDNTVREACTAAKNAGIKIYTVAFMAPPKGQDLLKFCASTPSNYYESDSTDALIAAFSDIAAKATAQPSRLTN